MEKAHHYAFMIETQVGLVVTAVLSVVMLTLSISSLRPVVIGNTLIALSKHDMANRVSWLMHRSGQLLPLC